MWKNVKKYLAIANRAKEFTTSRISSQNVAAAASTVPSDKCTPPGSKFEPGGHYDGFICKTVDYIPDFNMTAYQFEHVKLKSKYLHIDRNDPNNVFSINFRTTPFDSTGIPHILEHSVLCGSEKFPIRDPFFKMLNRSMATFMNAMTGPDYTLYPFSTMNRTDYHQLQKIYLDAVFKPNLNYLDFLQEGWRLENSALTDIESAHVIKGVVYNEMKGAFSENSQLFGSKFLNNILPDHTYGHCSGGDPLDIPNLTHDALVTFHRKYYHPSNCRFFSYGDFPLAPTLRYINNEYLTHYDPISNDFSKIPLQRRWTQPRNQHIVTRFDNMGAPIERQNQIAIGFLLSDITDIYETLLLHVLTELLVKGPNSLFYQNLVEPNFSGGYSRMTGFESSIRDTMFVVGLQDVSKDDFGRVEELVTKTIEQAIATGFDSDHVNSVLNNIELSLKHQSPKFGLGLLFNLTPVWNHDGNIIETLNVGVLIGRLRKNLQNPQYLQEKVKHYFKHGQHKLIMTMSPDQEYEQKFTESEQALITQKSSGLTDADRQQIYKNGLALADFQKLPQDINILPCLSLNDVETPPTVSHQLQQTSVLGVPTQICTVDTNNVSYFCGIFNANKLSVDQKLLLPLLANVIDQMGTTKQDYRSFDKNSTAFTSGINFGLHFADGVSDLSKFNVGMCFSSYCLVENIPKMFELMQELLKSFNFSDVQRFEMLLQNYSSALSVGITSSGHLYAMQSAAALVNDAAHLKARLGGIEHIDFIRSLIETTKPDQILEQLKQIATVLFNESNLKCALNTSEASRDKYIKDFTRFVEDTAGNATQSEPFDWLTSKTRPSSNVQNVMTIPVNYCAKSLLTVPYTHEDYASLKVLGKVLTSKYLLPTVREENGAYGAGAKINMDGLFNFYSYRDPNTRKTLDAFDASEKWIRANWSKIDNQLLFEAKLGVLQEVDAPTAPGNKGMGYFKSGITEDMRSEHRARVLLVSQNDLDRVTDRYLKEGTVQSVGRFVLGPENDALSGGSEKWTVK